MANNVGITPGVGASVATEDQGGIQVQTITMGARRSTPFTEVAINCAANGDNIIVAAVALKLVRLYGFFLGVQAAVDLKWKDGAGADLHPVLSLLGKGATWMLPRDSNPWFTTSAGNALILNLSGAFQVSGRAYYVQE